MELEGLEQLITHLSVIGTGLATGLFGLMHRGRYDYDEKRRVNVARGDGLAQKIGKYFPKYKTVAPAIDHFAASVAVTTVGGGVIAAELHLLGATDPMQFIVGYGLAVCFYAGNEGCWEVRELSSRKKDIGDYLQVTADLAAPVAVLTTLYHLMF